MLLSRQQAHSAQMLSTWRQLLALVQQLGLYDTAANPRDHVNKAINVLQDLETAAPSRGDWETLVLKKKVREASCQLAAGFWQPVWV